VAYIYVVDIASFVQVYYLVPEVTWQQSSASGDVMRELGVYIPPSLSSLAGCLVVISARRNGDRSDRKSCWRVFVFHGPMINVTGEEEYCCCNG
jgi:hypothetical protein